MEKDFLKIVEATIDKEADFLNHISLEIWKHPEIKHEEKFAHELLTNALIEKGFAVKKHHVLPTAFLAEYDSKKPGPTVAVLCEYDALPSVGHACGHNLIAEAGIGAGIAIKAAMENISGIPGKVVVVGTPAEEGGFGKIHLLKAGVFNDVDVALMSHPAPEDRLYPHFLAVRKMTISFIGKEVHASGFPWEGINALDAVVSCYNNIALLRQQIKATCKIHGIITKGGDDPSIIPGNTEMVLYYRAGTSYDMENLKQRIEGCIKAAAMATGCKYNIQYHSDFDYKSVITNQPLAEIYKKYAEDLGVCFMDRTNSRSIPFMGSTDMGNVSFEVPSIHPTYSIGTKAINHSEAFTQACATPEAHETTLISAKSMAMLGLKVLCDKDFLSEVNETFKSSILEDAIYHL